MSHKGATKITVKNDGKKLCSQDWCVIYSMWGSVNEVTDKQGEVIYSCLCPQLKKKIAADEKEWPFLCFIYLYTRLESMEF